MSNQSESQRKVFALLKKMSKSNLKKLTEYLESNYFKKEEIVLQLFDFISPLYPRFLKFEKEKAKAFLFSQKTERNLDNELNDVFSALFKKILDFIALENFLKDQSAQEDYTIEHFYQHQFYSWFENSLLKKRKRLNKQPNRNADYFYKRMKSFDKFYFHPETDKFKKAKPAKKKDEKMDLIEANRNLEISFMLSRFRYAIELLQRERIFSESASNTHFLDYLIRYSIEVAYFENPIIEIYVSLISLARDKEFKVDFAMLIDQFENHADLLDTLERRELHQFFLNEVSFRSRFCTGSALEQQTNFQLQLYKIGLAKNCLVVFKRMSDVAFTNLIITFCKNDDFAFAESIISKYQKFLPPPVSRKNEVVRFSWICIYFYREEYSAAIEILNKKNKFTPLFLEHRARVLRLCCKYEVFLQGRETIEAEDKSLESIEKAIGNYIRFYERKPQLRNDKIKPYLNFGRTLNKVFLAKDLLRKDRQNEKRKILNSLKTYKSIAVEKWLLKHIGKL